MQESLGSSNLVQVEQSPRSTIGHKVIFSFVRRKMLNGTQHDEREGILESDGVLYSVHFRNYNLTWTHPKDGNSCSVV